MMNGFDTIARSYDALARFVFGKSISNSQTIFLHHLQECSSVLVLGGGTGWWLNDLLEKYPLLKITFIDTSAEMIRLAKRNLKDDSRVMFIHGSLESIPKKGTFDAIVLFYILDMFKDDELQILIEQVKSKMRQDALWLVADFVNDKLWHAVMIKIMYLFFRLVAGLRTNSLPDWRENLNKTNQQIDRKYFYRGFICSAVYKSEQ